MGVSNDVAGDDMAAFSDPDFFGEAVTVTVRASGIQLTFNAVVFRDPVSPVRGTGKPTSPAPSLRVQIPYDADSIVGMPSRPIASADTIAIADQTVGASSTIEHAIVKILSEDAGGWLVELR